MKQLQYDHAQICNHFSNGHFGIQKSVIAGVAIGKDHASEQEVKKLKTRGSITGITRNENSRKWYFLVASSLSEISKEMEVMGNGIEVERKNIIINLAQPTLTKTNVFIIYSIFLKIIIFNF